MEPPPLQWSVASFWHSVGVRISFFQTKVGGPGCKTPAFAPVACALKQASMPPVAPWRTLGIAGAAKSVRRCYSTDA